MLSIIYAIALNTFREAIRSKVLYAIMFFAALLILSSLAFASLALTEQERVIKDFGLFTLTMFSVAITIVTGVSLLYKEIDRKTIYTIITKPVQRWQFLVGKFAGIIATVGLELLLMALIFKGLLLFRGDEAGLILLQALTLICVEVCVVASLAILFSAFSSPFLSGLLTVMMLITGHLYDQVALIAQEGGWAGAALTVCLQILPDMTLFNLSRELTYNLPVSLDRIAFATGYGLTYTTAALICGALIFHRRDFV
jgi:ABC-type transport system involved in multi-copper enzyme maturation permease subunit